MQHDAIPTTYKQCPWTRLDPRHCLHAPPVRQARHRHPLSCRCHCSTIRQASLPHHGGTGHGASTVRQERHRSPFLRTSLHFFPKPVVIGCVRDMLSSVPSLAFQNMMSWPPASTSTSTSTSSLPTCTPPAMPGFCSGRNHHRAQFLHQTSCHRVCGLAVIEDLDSSKV